MISGCSPIPEWSNYDNQSENNFPGEHWAKLAEPEELGWSSARLAEAQAFSKKIGSSAVMIVQKGIVVSAWGGVTTKSNLHSGRKSLLSGLIGIAVGRGEINLKATMAELNIDDVEPSLTDREKTAGKWTP